MAELQFEKYAKGSVALKNREGERIVMKVRDLSVVDRLFLIDECSVREGECLEGHVNRIETNYKVSRSAVEKRDPVFFKCSDSEIELEVFETPHFRILVEGRLDVKEFGIQLEKLWFYQAYRNPIFAQETGKLKTVVTVLTSEKGVDDLFAYLSEAITEMSEQKKEQLVDSRTTKLRGYPLPRGYSEKEGLMRTAYLIRNDELDLVDKQQFRLSAGLPRFLLTTHGLGGTFTTREDKGIYFYLGMGFDSEITFHEEIRTGLISDGNGSRAWGEPRKWSKKLVKALKSGESNWTISDYCTGSLGLIPEPFFGEYVTAVSMFIRSDMKKEIGTARFLKLAKEKNDYPGLEAFVASYGYGGAEEMEEDLLEYLESGQLE
ncbi:MAG: hypothetical protein ACSHX7_04610 [Luteolibacter sp.]